MDAMLIELFGVGWANLLADGVEDDSLGAALGVLFGLFNAAVSLVTVAALVLIALTAIGDTAQSGRVMGVNGSMWVPVRAVLAASMLVPVVKGYSLLQVLILSLVVHFSVTLANTMAVEVTGFISLENGTFTDPVPIQVRGVAEQMLYSQVCRQYFNEIEYDSSQGAAGQIISNISTEVTDGAHRFRWSFDGDDYSGQGEAACGAYIITCADKHPDTLTMCQSQLNSLVQLGRDLTPVALELIYDEPSDLATVAQAALDYESRARHILTQRTAALSANDQETNAKQQLVLSVEQSGFVLLGQWYMTLSAINQRTMKYAKPSLDSVPIDQSRSINGNLGIASYLQRTEALLRMKPKALIKTNTALDELARKQREIAGILGAEGTLGNYLAKHASSGYLQRDSDASKLFEFNENPLVGLQQLGSAMISLTSGFWADSRMQGVLSEQNGTESPNEVSTFVSHSISAVQSKLDNDDKQRLGTFASYLMILLFLSGLALSYYLPAIPFILWTFSVVGYLVLVLESLFAAPLWAASHALPKGNGLSSDASRQGYVLLLNLAVRPPIMVMGLIAGGALMMVAASFAMATFDVYSASLLESDIDVTSLLTFTCLFVVEVIILIALVHKCFALIYDASDKVVEWVTGYARPSGVASDEGRTSSASGAAQRSGEAAMGRAGYAARDSRAAVKDVTADQRFDH